MKKRRRVDGHTPRPDSRQGHVFHAPEFQYHDKNHYWYLGIGIIALAFAILTLRAGDYLMTAVVIAAAIAVMRVAQLKPDTRKIEITNKGVYWGDQLIPYHHIKHFWFSQVNGTVHVYLDRINIQPTVNFVVPVTKLESILETLIAHIPYHPHRNEPLSDRINRLLRI